MTSPTAPAAGVHLPWARVPAAVQAWASDLGGGGAPRGVRDLVGGFSPGATSILEWAERSLFVKAVGADLNAESPQMHRREIVVSSALPRSDHFPRLVDTYDDGSWVALAFEVVPGRPPHHPWRADELDRVAAALAGLHDELTPSPVPTVGPLEDYARALFGGWAELAGSGSAAGAAAEAGEGAGGGADATGPVAAAAPDVLDGLDPWARAHLEQLAELEASWPAACAGSTLVHGDIRADNVLLGDDAVVFVDWPHAAVGNPIFDLVAWAPSVVLEGGPAPEELMIRYDPAGRRVDPEALTVLLAAVAGFFVPRSLLPAPPGLPTLRAFQAAQGEVALAWLRRRTGW